MKKVVKGLVSTALVAAVFVSAICYPKTVKAAKLKYDDVVKLTVYDAIDANSVDGLESALRDEDYNSAARWLLETVENANQRYNFSVDTSKVLKPLKKKLREMQESEYLQVSKSGILVELSKAYVVNAVSNLVMENLKEPPEVPDSLYEFVASKSVTTENLFSKLNQYVEEHPEAVNTDEQLDALHTIVMSMQYNVGTSAERTLKENQKQHQLDTVQKLINGQEAEGSAVDASYVDKFYAINQIQTYLDIVYDDTVNSGGFVDDNAESSSIADGTTKNTIDSSINDDEAENNVEMDSTAKNSVATITYADVSDAYNNLKSSLTDATSPTAVDSDVVIVSQMNEIQLLLKSYISSLDELYHLGLYTASQDVNAYADVQNAYNETLIVASSDQGIQSYQVGVSAEDLDSVQSDIDETRDSVNNAHAGIKELKSKYSVLSMRTASDMTRIYDDISSLSTTDNNLLSSVSTLTMKTKTDLDTLLRKTEKADEDVKMQSDESDTAIRQHADAGDDAVRQHADAGDNAVRQHADAGDDAVRQHADAADTALDERTTILESQLFTTVLNGFTIRAGNWAWDAGKNQYYYNVSNPTITPDCLIQIEYDNDPPIIPEYVQTNGRLTIYAGNQCGNPEVRVKVLTIYSSKHM